MPSDLLHSGFLTQAATQPSRPAVIGPSGELSYGELRVRSDALARRLRRLGARPARLVAVVLDKGWEQLVAVLGILRSGAAYLPVDPALPRDRIQTMLADGEVELAVTDRRLESRISWPSGVRTVTVDDALGEPEASLPDGPAQEATDLAYVLFTSGSTGRPKGVMIEHRSALNTIVDVNRRFDVGPGDRTLALSSLGFDLSVYDLFGTLAAGGTVVMPAPGTSREPAHWAELMTRYRVTVWNSVPVLMRMLVEHLEAGDDGLAKPLRLVLLSGDWIPVGLPDRVRALGPGVRVVGLGGATEGSIWSILFPIGEVDPAWQRIPYGRPMANQDVTVRDALLRRCRPEEPGELCIEGRGLSRGYWRDARRTAERFVPDPGSGGRLYRTGDHGVSRSDGILEILGRRDHQVKIQGLRIELGEIEAVARSHPSVRGAVVLAPRTPSGERHLVAFLATADDGSEVAGSVGEFLAAKLPAAMVPGRFVVLDEIPLTASGKPDRRALAERLPAPPSAAAGDGEGAFGPTERLVADLWREVLGAESVGADTDFFQLGGRSLQAAQVVARLRRRLGVDLPLGALFEHPTAASLARRVDGDRRHRAGRGEALVRASWGDPPPLSFSQERVWFLERLADTRGAYHFQATLRFRGQLDIEALEWSLNEIVRRHEILRTTFPRRDSAPVQRIHPPWAIELPVEATPPEELRRAIDREIARAFRVDRLPLVRWRLLRLAPQDHVLVHVEHHLLHDGWSFTLVLRELATLYTARVRGEPSPLAEPEVQFADFAIRQREWMDGPVAAAQLAYWKEQLSGPPPPLSLPLDRPRKPTQTFRGDALRIELPAEPLAALRAVDAGASATLFMRLLALFFVLLGRYVGQLDVSVGTGVAARRWPETERMLGMLLNNLVLRADLSGDPGFLELLGRIRRVVLEAFAHQDTPFDRVVKGVGPPRDASRNPLFQVMFSFHDTPLPALDLPGLDVEVREALSNGSAKFDLNVIAIPNLGQRGTARAEGGMTLVWEYNTDLLDGTTVRRMAGHFAELLASAAREPATPMSRLPMMSAPERHRLLVEINDTDLGGSRHDRVHDLLEEQSSRRPEAVAVATDGRWISYGELDRSANRLARRLRRLGVGPEVAVALCLERSLDRIIALTAILKAGGHYVPLDPALPERRLRFVLEDCRAGLVLTRRRIADGLQLSNVRRFVLEDETEAIAAESGRRLAPTAVADALAYVLYTSGSTGTPKGVAVTHRNVVRLARGVEPGASGFDQVFLHMAPLSFDASTFEIWGSLLHGARLVLAPQETSSLGSLAALLGRHRVTTLWLTAALFHQVVERHPEGLAGLRRLFAGGDVLGSAAVRKARRELPGVRLVDGYGPTEATTFTCCFAITDDARWERSVPIGRPIGGTRVHVLAPGLEPVPGGVPGELFVGGDGVARGYVDRPGPSAERFVPDPFGRPGERLYRTGDRVRYLGSGNLEFLGRLDRQLKVRGFRIEPAEVEAALLEHPAVRAAAVAVDSSQSDGDRLVAWFEGTGRDGAPGTGQLREHLRSILPGYMVPAVFVTLDSLPLTSRGKLDSAALPPPGGERSEDLGSPVLSPRTAVEATVARIWKDLLKVTRIGLGDDFFELGGDSLLVNGMVARVQDEIGVELPMSRVFEAPTVRDLASVIGELDPEAEGRVAPREQRSVPSSDWARTAAPRDDLLRK